MTIDYKALAERLKAHAECHSNVEPFDDEQRQWADDLRTVVTMLGGMAKAKPDGEVVVISPNDAIVRWTGHSRPTIGDSVYLHPAPQPQPTEAQIEARDALLDFISENGTASEGVQHYLDRYVRAALAAKEQPK